MSGRTGTVGCLETTGGAILLEAVERLLALESTQLSPALRSAAHLLASALGADKVDVFLLDPASRSLTAAGVSTTPMGERQRALGLDRIPLVIGGRSVEVFRTGRPFITGEAEADPIELRGIVHELGVRSSVMAPIDVQGTRRGVLLASSAEPRRFGDAHLTFTIAAARWVGHVIHRTELIERATNAAVEEARLREAEDLAAGLAHDLRNRLTPVRLRLQYLRRTLPEQDRRVAMIDEAIGNIDSTGTLLHKLLEAVRLGEGLRDLQLELVDLVELAHAAADAVRRPLVDLEVRASGTLIVEADRMRLQQCLENVVANAVQHSPEGSRVTIEVMAERTDRSVAIVRVTDQGAGIEPEVVPHLFRRFAKGPRSPGTGLGLYLAQQIASAHGGALELERTSPTGTTFRLRLPAVPRAEDIDEALEPETAEDAFAG